MDPPRTGHRRRCIVAVLVALIADVALAVAAVAPPPPPPTVDLFVSPTGSDANDGAALARPFGTLARAQQEVRARRLAQPDAAITVHLRGGRYELPATWDLGPEDSGASAAAPVTYQAYCDTEAAAEQRSLEPYPYADAGTLGAPPVAAPRRRWNGLGNRTQWRGPSDPFAAMGVDRARNSLLTRPPAAPAVPDMDLGGVCVDEVGAGHACFAPAGPVEACVEGCQVACARDLARRDPAGPLRREFAHLFGRDLAREEDCVEVCGRSCRGCEAVVVSGARRLRVGAAAWSLARTLPSGLRVFVADLAPALAGLPGVDAATAAADNNPAVFSRLYVDGRLYPRAGFPDCRVVPDGVDDDASANGDDGRLDCAFAPVRPQQQPPPPNAPRVLGFDPATFSPRVGQWSRVSGIEVELRPLGVNGSNARFHLAAVDGPTTTLVLGAGGAQLAPNGGLPPPPGAVFRVENVWEELDAPGEWFYDPATQRLHLIPVDAPTTATPAALGALELELPWLRQLVRVRGSRANAITAPAHAARTLLETDSDAAVARHLAFRFLTFSGTQAIASDLHERMPGRRVSPSASSSGPPWPIARLGAVFLETVADVAVAHCRFERVAGNAVVLSGATDGVHVLHNNISFVGGSGIAVLARAWAPRDALGARVRGRLLASRGAHLAFNQIHHIGRRQRRVAAIMVVGARQTVVDGNLIYALPPLPAASSPYWLVNADGASGDNDENDVDAWTPLELRPMAPIAIPPTAAAALGVPYVVAVPIGVDVPVVAKLIGAPPCPTGGGRVDAPYGGEPRGPFGYTQCAGCCGLHANAARLRVAGAGVAWADATREAVLLPGPGRVLELQAPSSPLFNAATDVFVGFHVAGPNELLELPGARAHWRIVTRPCRYEEDTYVATCGGPCAALGAPEGCGNSNAAVQTHGALRCRAGYEPDATTHACEGPFDGLADCDGSGVARPHRYYNCSIHCATTTCT